MKTEKISVNLSPVELGQIDCLVERGLFDSRSDFMRSAARKSLDNYSDEFQKFLNPEHLSGESTGLWFTIGITALSKNDVKNFIASNKKINIRVIGLLNISNSITPNEIKQVVKSCKVHGKLVASKEAKEALREIEETDE
ncbi:MAG: hypothetical protein FWD44_06860 [Oscillospiraceae bacterium]|nr:hypothetical protein [Oscillospiraceae bacterium]